MIVKILVGFTHEEFGQKREKRKEESRHLGFVRGVWRGPFLGLGQVWKMTGKKILESVEI